jgi:4a-hydroxytetrahydrobiopterin dehydratase
MELAYRLLSSQELASGLEGLPGWQVVDGKLHKVYSFDDYAMGVVFASSVGYVANKLDHHPDILIGYQKVDVSVNTHAVKGLSPYDLELARRIESLV